MAPLRVLHLVGSAESEFLCDLSRLYAVDCLATVADEERYRPVIAYVTPDRDWRFPEGLDAEQIAAAPPHQVGAAIRVLAGLAIDVAVPQMFCRAGMTSYRALLDLLGIPYVGNPPDVMAIGADKERAKRLVASAGVDVPAGVVVGPAERPAPARFPVVVKPLDSDNSFGVSLVRRPDDLAVALASAREHGDRVLIEDYVELGREVRCGVLEVDGGLVPLPLEEYGVDAERPIRRTEDKIARAAAGELALVAKGGPRARIVAPEDPVTEPVWEAARLALRALGCRDYGLFDFRVDPDGRPWFIEAGLYCSFARQSVIATMADAAGIDARHLFAGAVRDTLIRESRVAG
jgi:D-alanine-D-alanine ligase